MNKATKAEANRRLRERLRAARIEAGLSQEEVAKAIGQPQSFVSKMESSGERSLDFVELEEIAELYGKRLDYFRSFRVHTGEQR